MAQQIRFLVPMSPHSVGDTRVVADDTAKRMIAAGEAERMPSAFDSGTRDIVAEPRPATPRRHYKTRLPLLHTRG